MLGLSDTAVSSSSFCSCPWGHVPQLPGSDASPDAKCWGEGEVAAWSLFFINLCSVRIVGGFLPC